MKGFMKIMALLCALVLLLTGCGTKQPQTTEPSAQEDTAMLSKDKTYSILFIGNSYTFYNDMPTAYFEVMAKTCGYDVRVTAITKGAHTLEEFADPADSYGKMVDNALSVPGTYDYVILQEQSVRPSVDTVPAFYDAVRDLAQRIRAVGAKPILYATWGRQTGNSKLEEYGMTNESMTWKLAAAYSAIGAELDIPVMHVGLAFYQVNTNSQIDLYNADLSHPSATGSYLAAMTLFCGVFDVDPVEASFAGPVSAEEDAILRDAARMALQNTPEIPEEYRTTSENVSGT